MKGNLSLLLLTVWLLVLPVTLLLSSKATGSPKMKYGFFFGLDSDGGRRHI